MLPAGQSASESRCSPSGSPLSRRPKAAHRVSQQAKRVPCVVVEVIGKLMERGQSWVGPKNVIWLKSIAKVKEGSRKGPNMRTPDAVHPGGRIFRWVPRRGVIKEGGPYSPVCRGYCRYPDSFLYVLR